MLRLTTQSYGANPGLAPFSLFLDTENHQGQASSGDDLLASNMCYQLFPRDLFNRLRYYHPTEGTAALTRPELLNSNMPSTHLSISDQIRLDPSE
jgi:hypothetical protein